MISVLLPSRGRPRPLAASIASLRDRAADPARLAFLVARDPDDTATADAAYSAGADVWTAPRRFGYHGLDQYLNGLLPLAPDGGWLLLWNDDAAMLTDGWDDLIRAEDPAVLWPSANHSQHANCFPAWPRAWAGALGHVTRSPHADTYLQWLGEELGRLVRIGAEVFHDRFDVTGGNGDATWKEGRGQIGTDGMLPGCIPDRELIRADAALIRGLA